MAFLSTDAIRRDELPAFTLVRYDLLIGVAQIPLIDCIVTRTRLRGFRTSISERCPSSWRDCFR